MDTLPSPDVVIRRTHRTMRGAPIRILNLVTLKAEEWAALNAPDAERLDGSLILPKSEVEEMCTRMVDAGLIVVIASHFAFGGHS